MAGIYVVWSGLVFVPITSQGEKYLSGMLPNRQVHPVAQDGFDGGLTQILKTVWEFFATFFF